MVVTLSSYLRGLLIKVGHGLYSEKTLPRTTQIRRFHRSMFKSSLQLWFSKESKLGIQTSTSNWILQNGKRVVYRCLHIPEEASLIWWENFVVGICHRFHWFPLWARFTSVSCELYYYFVLQTLGGCYIRSLIDFPNILSYLERYRRKGKSNRRKKLKSEIIPALKKIGFSKFKVLEC